MVSSRRTRMATTSLEAEKERFAEWRRQKRGGGRIPNELWQMVAAHIPTLGLNSVAEEFCLDLSRLREKAQQLDVAFGKSKRESSAAGVAFQELPLDGIFGATPHVLPCL